MAKKLKGLKLDRIDLVDKGANPGAMITLFKRDTMAEKPTPEQQIEALTKSVADLTKRATDAEAEVLKLKAKPVEPPKPEDVLKGASPEVQALIKSTNERLEKAEKDARENRERLEKAEEKAELESFTKRAEELSGIGIAKSHAPILRKIAKALTADENKEFDRVLKALQEQVAKGALFVALGADGGEDGAEPLAKIEKMATDRAAKSAGKETYQQAYSAILETPEGKQLYAESRRN